MSTEYTPMEMLFFQQLAANAPAVPDWFEPSGVAERPEIPQAPWCGSPDEARLDDEYVALHTFMNESEVSPIVAVHAKAHSEAWKAMKVWKREYEQQRLFQWPAAYAFGVIDAMRSVTGRLRSQS